MQAPERHLQQPVKTKSMAAVHLISRSRIGDLPPSSSLRRRVLSVSAYSLHPYEPDTVRQARPPEPAHRRSYKPFWQA